MLLLYTLLLPPIDNIIQNEEKDLKIIISGAWNLPEKELESQTPYKKVQVFILRNIKMFKRKILDEINKWKNLLNIKKRALVIQGLRQIGKTTVVLNYCKKNYENVIALIPTQHYNYAHSNFNTQTINIDIQYKCLVVKMQNIFKNLKSNNEEHIYIVRKDF